jgi:hypothetical protein
MVPTNLIPVFVTTLGSAPTKWKFWRVVRSLTVSAYAPARTVVTRRPSLSRSSTRPVRLTVASR